MNRIGVVSYLLVNFWYTRMAANRSAMMALLTNRVGDWGYSLGMFALIGTIASLDFATWFGVAWGYNHGVNEIICCLLVIGVVGKSSQIGLHTWLPWAMEGPTPVSALLHAATLVTAGIFLLLRISPVLEFAPQTLTILTFLGGFTAFLGGSLGLVANDMKKVIAYSTMSQLGYCSTVKHKPENREILQLHKSIQIYYFPIRLFTTDNKRNLNAEKLDNLPLNYVERFVNVSYSHYEIKTNYRKCSLIYLWFNKINNKTYVGKTVNLAARLSKYLNPNYLNKHRQSMAICAALLSHNIRNFEFYILEIVSSNGEKVSEKDLSNKPDMLTLKEHFWWEIVKPSYNIQNILKPFTGPNHYRYNKKVSDETKKRISDSLKGRIKSFLEKENHSLGNTKKINFDCYDFNDPYRYVCSFIGINKMAKQTNVSNTTVRRCLADEKKPFKAFYNNKPVLWLLKKQS